MPATRPGSPGERHGPAVSDEQLVETYTGSGDREAADELIRRYSPRLRRMIVALTRLDSASVKDIEQEVFITLIRRMKQFKGRSSFSTFFYRLARNRTLDLLRSRNRYGRRVVPFAEPDRSAGRMPGPEELFLRDEKAEMLRQAMETLRPEDRTLLYLKDGENMSVEELCELSDMPSGTVKSKLARSRSRVAKALGELGYET